MRRSHNIPLRNEKISVKSELMHATRLVLSTHSSIRFDVICFGWGRRTPSVGMHYPNWFDTEKKALTPVILNSKIHVIWMDTSPRRMVNLLSCFKKPETTVYTCKQPVALSHQNQTKIRRICITSPLRRQETGIINKRTLLVCPF